MMDFEGGVEIGFLFQRDNIESLGMCEKLVKSKGCWVINIVKVEILDFKVNECLLQ